MAEDDTKEGKAQSLLTTLGIGKGVSYIQNLAYAAYEYGTHTPTGGFDSFEFVPMINIASEALGYFENRKDNTYIKVTRDAIILNELNEIDNGDLSQNPQGKQTVIESIAGEYYNILPQSIEHTQVFGDGCGFTYDNENDAWTYGYGGEMYKEETKKHENDRRQIGHPWTRINFDLKSNASYVIVIGDTGVGKSSLLKLLTNYNGIKTSDGDESCTTSTSFYALLSKNICFVDTRGTEDSDTSVTDLQTLNEIQRKMHRFHGSLCKIIWIVHPASKKNKHLQQQVSFISKLGETVNEAAQNEEKKENNNDNNNDNKEVNIWDSVMVIVSQPKARVNLIKEAKGVIGKAQEKGCSKDHWKVGKNLFGYTNLDWMDRKERKKMKKDLKRELKGDKDDDSDSDSDSDSSMNDSDTNDKKEPAHHGNGLHYYWNQEIKSLIYDSLLNNEFIEPFILLNLNYKCGKCGIIGNPKFVDDLKCHSKVIKYHPLRVSSCDDNNPGQMINCMRYTHSSDGNRERKHTGKVVSFHSKALRVKYHSGKIQRRHPMEPVLSTGGKWAIGITAVAGAAAGGAAALSLITGAAASAAGVGTTAAVVEATTATAAAATGAAEVGAASLSLGGKIIGATAVIRARNAIARGFTHLGYESCGTYPCCGGNMVSEGCKREYNCCNKTIGDQGCRELKENDRRYECCGNGVNHGGCKKRYDCCGRSPISVGCRIACGDCKEFLNSRACSYEMQCCGIKGSLKDKNDEKDGCLMKCQHCQKPWGQPISLNDKYWKDNGGSPSEPQGCCGWYSHQMVKID